MYPLENVYVSFILSVISEYFLSIHQQHHIQCLRLSRDLESPACCSILTHALVVHLVAQFEPVLSLSHSLNIIFFFESEFFYLLSFYTKPHLQDTQIL
jgi:hypothetical protein